MLEKKHRLQESQVKKVLASGKPFFSFGVVLNYLQNNLQHNRFAVVIGAKSTLTGVERNYFRRKFYDLVKPSISLPQKNVFFDLVFVVKKSTLLSKKNPESEALFHKDIDFLLKKTFPHER